jgi:hypothetical protein
MNPLPKSYKGASTGPIIGDPKHDGPLVVEIPGYGVDHTLATDSNGQLQRGYRPASVVVDGKGFQQLGGFLSFEELDNALGMKVADSQRKFPGSNVVFDGGNSYYVQPGKNTTIGDKWENATAGLKELMNPVRKVKKQNKSHETPEYFVKDGLDKLAQQKWKLISPGEYWPGTCFPLITIRKPILIPEHSESDRLQNTLPIQVLQQAPKRIVDNIQMVQPVLANPIKGDTMHIPPALVDYRDQTLAASTMAVPIEAQFPTAFGTMQVPISTVHVTQQHALSFQNNNPGHHLVNGPAIAFQPY